MESVGVIMYKKYDYKKPKLIASKLYESNDDVAISVAPQNEQKRRRFDNVCVDLKKYARAHNGKLEISISEKNVGYIKLYCDGIYNIDSKDNSRIIFANLLIDFENTFIFIDNDNVCFMLVEDLSVREKIPDL